MVLWNFIEQHLFPLFGEIPPEALEKVQMIFWITLGCVIVHALVYLPYRGMLALIHKCKWKGKWLL